MFFIMSVLNWFMCVCAFFYHKQGIYQCKTIPSLLGRKCRCLVSTSSVLKVVSLSRPVSALSKRRVILGPQIPLAFINLGFRCYFTIYANKMCLKLYAGFISWIFFTLISYRSFLNLWTHYYDMGYHFAFRKYGYWGLLSVKMCEMIKS